MTVLPDGAGVWDEQELTASLSLWHSRVSHPAGPAVWRGLDTSMEGLNNSAGESLRMAPLFLAGSIVLSLWSLGTQRRCQEMTHSGFAKQESAVFLMLSLSSSSNPVLGLGFPW